MDSSYKNIGYFFLVFIVFVPLGFYYPYFSLFPDFKSVTTVIHIHTAALLLWIVILITQPLLIACQKFKTHRLIGKFTYFLMPLIVITCVAVLRKQYDEGITQKMTAPASLKTLYTSAEELLFIIIFYSLAVFKIWKGNVGSHMRYMICLALEFIPPSFGRTLGYWLNMRQYHTYNISILLCTMILIILITYDWQKKLNCTPYVLALSLFLIFHAGWYILGHPI